jgi:hypothetical protein
MAKCSGITRAGTAYKGTPMDGSEWCYIHDPDTAETRRRHGRKGGKRGGRGRPMAELHSIRDKLETLAEDVLAGRVDRSDAAVVGQLYNTLIRAVSVEMNVREITELTQRLEELEALTEQNKQRGRGWG